MDATGRLDPEGYVYARSHLPMKSDATGLETSLSPGNVLCTPEETKSLRNAISEALSQVQKCADGLCGRGISDVVRRRWIRDLNHMRFTCLNTSSPWVAGTPVQQVLKDGTFVLADSEACGAMSIPRVPDTNDAESIYTDAWIFNPLASRPLPDCTSQCLRQSIAHEALHTSLKFIKTLDFVAAPMRPSHEYVHDAFDKLTPFGDRVTFSERLINWTVLECVNCKK